MGLTDMAKNAMDQVEKGLSAAQTPPKWEAVEMEVSGDCCKACWCPCMSMSDYFGTLEQSDAGKSSVMMVGAFMTLRYLGCVLSSVFPAVLPADSSSYILMIPTFMYLVFWLAMVLAQNNARGVLEESNNIEKSEEGCKNLCCMCFCHCWSIGQERKTCEKIKETRDNPVGGAINAATNAIGSLIK